MNEKKIWPLERKEYVWPLWRESLDDYYEMTTRCALCNYCKWVYASDVEDWRFAHQCPTGQRYKFNAFFAQGRMQVARLLMEGVLRWDDPTVRDVLFLCSTCGACEEWCSFISGNAPLKLVEALRETYVKLLGPHPGHKRFLKSVEDNRNAYLEPHEERFKWMPSDISPPRKADVIYFVGCTSAYREQHLAQATVRVLNELGVDFGVLWEDEWCCGSPALRTGAVSLGKKMMKHNIEALRKAGAKTLITECAGCFKTFGEAWKYGLDVPVKVMHVSQFILDRMKELARNGRLNRVDMKVTYHDPCHLGRGMGVYDEPREILKLIPGLELVEMPRNRKNSWCCGSGGGVKSAYPDFALWSAMNRLEEAEFIKVDAIVTPCPFCVRNLRDAANFSGNEIKVVDLIEVILKAIKG